MIFDLDGVLVDSERIWDEVRRAVVAEHGGTWRDGGDPRAAGDEHPGVGPLPGGGAGRAAHAAGDRDARGQAHGGSVRRGAAVDPGRGGGRAPGVGAVAGGDRELVAGDPDQGVPGRDRACRWGRRCRPSRSGPGSRRRTCTCGRPSCWGSRPRTARPSRTRRTGCGRRWRRGWRCTRCRTRTSRRTRRSCGRPRRWWRRSPTCRGHSGSADARRARAASRARHRPGTPGPRRRPGRPACLGSGRPARCRAAALLQRSTREVDGLARGQRPPGLADVTGATDDPPAIRRSAAHCGDFVPYCGVSRVRSWPTGMRRDTEQLAGPGVRPDAEKATTSHVSVCPVKSVTVALPPW